MRPLPERHGISGIETRFLRMLVLSLVLIAIPAGAAANPVSPVQLEDAPGLASYAGVSDSTVVPMEWTRAAEHAEFSGRQGHSTVVFDNSLWVIAGATPQSVYFSDIWRSDDGITWRRVTPEAAFGKRAGHRSVVFNDRIWVIGGRDGNTKEPLNDVWYSSDGVTWKCAMDSAPFAPRWDFDSIVSGGRIWVIGGSEDGPVHNDVWYSSDGVTWHEATPHAGFSPRMEPSAVFFKGKMWVTGGFDWKGVYNDVWSSDDGTEWTRVILHAPFAPRRYQNMETADGKIWVIGGYDGKKTINDVWLTGDGISWTPAKGKNTFPPRYAFTTAVFNNRLWVIAGTTGNDVWYSDELGSSSPGVPEPSYGSVNNRSGAILVTKTVFPLSIKQGTSTRITVTVHNNGTTPIHDIEILDTPHREFRVTEGVTRFAADTIEPDETRILTYTVQAEKAGSFRLNRTAVMFAGEDGNYRVVYSGFETIRVLPSLIDPEPEELPDTFFRDLIAWINSFDPFA